MGHKFPPDVHLDPLITGNAFCEDRKYMERCQKLYNRKLIAYEMEAGGFAKACHGEGVPFWLFVAYLTGQMRMLATTLGVNTHR